MPAAAAENQEVPSPQSQEVASVHPAASALQTQAASPSPAAGTPAAAQNPGDGNPAVRHSQPGLEAVVAVVLREEEVRGH